MQKMYNTVCVTVISKNVQFGTIFQDLVTNNRQ